MFDQGEQSAPSTASPVTKADLKDLLNSFSANIDERFKTVSEDLSSLHDSQQRSKDLISEKFRETETKFRKEGNRIQHNFNQQVSDKCCIN